MPIKSQSQGNVTIITPTAARFDIQFIPTFKEGITAQIQPGSAVVIDLGTVEFIDSTGMGALISLHRHAREIDSTVVLANATNQTIAMFRLMKINRIFDIYPTIDEAVSALAS